MKSKNTEKILFNIDPETKEKLFKYAQENDLPAAHLIRLAIRRLLEK